MNRALSTLQPVLHGAFLVCLLLTARASPAQTTFDIPTANEGAPIRNKPYIAEKLSHSKRSLADGTVTTQEAQVWEARDSNGRVLAEIKTTVPQTPSRPAMEFVLDSLMDPAAHTILVWNNLSKIATCEIFPRLQCALSLAATFGKARRRSSGQAGTGQQ